MLDRRHFESLHLLGVIAHLVGKNDLSRSIPSNKLCGCILAFSSGPLQSRRGLSMALGRIEEAERSFQEAIHLEPGLADAHNGLGNLLIDLGRFDDAIARLPEALRLRPIFPSGAQQFWQRSQGARRRSTKRPPAIGRRCGSGSTMPRLYNNLGNILGEQGLHRRGRRQFPPGLMASKPDFATAHNNLGNSLLVQGKMDEAIACYQQALRLQPDYADPCSNMANALIAKEKTSTRRVAWYKKALRMKSDHADAHYNLSLMLPPRGQFRRRMGGI